MKALEPNSVPISLYIHFPWCEKKCPYCDFNIETDKKDGDEEALLFAILKDLENSSKYIGSRKFTSLYFGGGTPSLISAKIIEKIIANKTPNDNAITGFTFKYANIKTDVGIKNNIGDI